MDGKTRKHRINDGRKWGKMEGYTEEEKGYIWLDSFQIEEGEKRRLLAEAGSAARLAGNFRFFGKSLIKSCGESVYNNMCAALSDGSCFDKTEKLFQKERIRAVTCASDEYPEALREKTDAPLVLYGKGDFSLLKKRMLTVVGSRRTPPAALKLGAKICEQVSSHLAILTGTADGGDRAAAEGALAGSGKVIAFAAGGFSHLPQGNFQLLNRVAERGLLLSAHSFFTPVRVFSYERRNALLAALGEGVFVIGAGEKSGALITANTALEQGRDVFAVPGPIDAPLSRGCNRLIADGAAGLITDSWDVLREYEAIYPHKILGERVELPRTLGYQAREEQARAKQAAAEEILSLPTLNLKTNDAGLTDDQIAILRTLKDGALQVDDLIEKTQIPTRRVLSALTMMELEGYVEQGSGKHFSLTVTLLEE